MKKILLSICTLFIAVGNIVSQETIHPANVNLAKRKISNQITKLATNNAAFKVALTSGVCNDTVRYQELKEAAIYTGTNTGYAGETAQGNLRSCSMGYKVPAGGAVVIQGIELYSGVSNTAVPTSTVNTKAYVYSVDAQMKPLVKIDSASVVLTTTIKRYYAMFSSPKTYTANFAVAFQAQGSPTDVIIFIYNSAQTSTSTVNNYGEGLSYRRFGSGVWNTSNALFTGTNDFEYIVSPIVSHAFSVDYTQSSNLLCPSTQLSLTNASTGTELFESPFFNLSRFGKRWNIPTTTLPQDSIYNWNLGNLTQSVTPNASYIVASSAGTSFDTLTVVKLNHSFDYCYQQEIKSYTISVCTGVNALTSSELIVYPNPSNGIITLNNMPYNSTIELINILGESIYKEKVATDSKSIDFSSIAKGNYYLKMTSNEGKITVKKLNFN